MIDWMRVGKALGRRMMLAAVLSLIAVSVLSCAGTDTPAQPTTPQQPTTPPSDTKADGEPSPSTEPESVVWAADGTVTPGEYANHLDLGTFRLFWSSSEDTIRIAMQADTQGWVAVGFQPGRRMRDADIVFGMMVDGVATVLDSYSTGDFGPHSADVNQGGADDLLSSGGVRTDSMTTFEFERSLDTGDARDVSLQRGVATQLIWSYGSSDNEKMQHSTRGYADIVP